MNTLKPAIRSRIIIGARCTTATDKTLRMSTADVSAATQLNLPVFEVQVDNQIRYCCWSGGTMQDDSGQDLATPRLTHVGQAALEALAMLPFVDPQGSLVIKELRIELTQLKSKVLRTFRQTAETRELICFVGDMSGELDGLMPMAFNVESPVNLADCVGLKTSSDPL